MIHHLTFALIGMLMLSACGPATPTTAPADFALAYSWSAGSLPPPYHYSYQIVITADGAGSMRMTPNYDGPDVPTWTETFVLSTEERDALFGALAAQGLLRERWRDDPQPPVGGSSALLQVTANNRVIRVPSAVVANQQPAAAAIHALVEAQVPPAIWEQLQAQRDAYVAEQGG